MVAANMRDKVYYLDLDKYKLGGLYVTFMVIVVSFNLLSCRENKASNVFVYKSNVDNSSIELTINKNGNYVNRYHLELKWFDVNNKEIASCPTNISSAHKWAAGWHPDKNIFIFYSGDTQSACAYEIVNDRLVFSDYKQVNQEIVDMSHKFYSQKYGKMPGPTPNL